VNVSQILERAVRTRTPVFSFEFFPPKTEEGTRQLFETLDGLKALLPAYVSVTWGAGGGARNTAFDLVKRLRNETDIETMAHLTCVGASRDEIASILDDFARVGVTSLLALRGDPPRGESSFVPHPDGFRHATELVRLVRSEPTRWPFCVGVAGYPEGHVETRDLALDLGHLATKVAAGADFVVTQLFFDNAHYVSFVERARAAGIQVPIVPGIMPFTNVEQIERITSSCGATIPSALKAAMRARADDPGAARELGVAYASLQCEALLRYGAPGIHFYTLNRSPSTRAILSALRAHGLG
jgi:methylenetetrahydrofolate reductase (NADPH)